MLNRLKNSKPVKNSKGKRKQIDTEPELADEEDNQDLSDTSLPGISSYICCPVSD